MGQLMSEIFREAVPSNDPRVQAALIDYFAKVDRGETLDLEPFVAQYADVADELRSFIAFDEEARRMAGGLARKARPSHADAAVVDPLRPKVEVSTHSVAGASIQTSADGQRKPTRTILPTGAGLNGPNEAGLSTPSAPAFASLVRPKVVAPAAPVPAASPLMKSPNDLPSSFGRYLVKQKLGEGAMGAVYQAKDTLLDRDVALKTPTFANDADGELMTRFYREARAVSKIKHQNLCGVYDVGEIGGRHYISMEYVPGKKLTEFIKPDKPMTEKQAMAVVRKIALAMHETHAHGVVHRDLKPDNIMVNEKGEPVVMDFGLVHQTDSQNSTQLSQRGSLIGSPAYMSKEQVEGDHEKLTGATDQYSLGVVLYQLLTSKLPFEGGIHAVLGAILVKEPPPPREYRPDLNPHLEAVCLKMMAKEAANRYPSMKAAADALAEVAKGTSKAAGSIIAPAQAAVGSYTDGLTRTFTGILFTPEQGTPSPFNFLDEVKATPLVEAKAARKQTATKVASVLAPLTAWWNSQPPPFRWTILGCASVALLFAVTLWFRSSDALVKVEVLNDDIEVTFQRGTITLADGGQKVKATPGQHTLHIKSGNVEFDTDKFTLKRGENPAVTVELVKSDVVTKLGNAVIDRRTLTTSVSGESSASSKTFKGTPADVVAFEKKLFKVFPEQLTWHEAKQKCEGMGGRLVQINSQAENDFVMKLAIERMLPGIWLGATDEVQERTWLWNNGDGLAFNNFGNGQPDRSTAGKRYLVMMLKDRVGGWCNQPDKSTAWTPGYVCEWNAPEGSGQTVTPKTATDTSQWTAAQKVLAIGGWITVDVDEKTNVGISKIDDLANKSFQIRGVGFDGNKFSNEALESLKGLTSIRELHLWNLWGTDISAEGFASINTLTGLEKLWFNVARSLNESTLTELKQLSKVRLLVFWATTLTDAGLVHLQNFPALQDVQLGSNSFTGEGLPGLKPLAKLWSVSMQSTKMSDAALRHLKALPQVTHWSLGGTPITDVGLNHLRGLKHIRFLAVDHTAVTDIGLRDLETLDGLEELSLQKTKVTEAGVKAFQKARPSCKVHFQKDESPETLTKAGERRLVTVDGIDFAFRWIPPTTSFPNKFQMGTPAGEVGHQADEAQVEVVLDKGYWMLETEITQAMYLAVTKTKPWQGKEYVKDGGKYPVAYVRHQNAIDFCVKLTTAARQAGVLSTKETIMLPTEAQWEWAARAGATTAYVSGPDDSKLGDFEWCRKNTWNVRERYAHEVGQKKPNAWGLLDISGNCTELCADWYADKLPGGTNPTGPIAGSSHVLRGGSFDDLAIGGRVGSRDDDDSARVYGSIGFRVAVSLE